MARIALLFAFLLVSFSAQAQSGPVVVLSVNGAIGPAVADYFHRGLEKVTLWEVRR